MGSEEHWISVCVSLDKKETNKQKTAHSVSYSEKTSSESLPKWSKTYFRFRKVSDSESKGWGERERVIQGRTKLCEKGVYRWLNERVKVV